MRRRTHAVRKVAVVVAVFTCATCARIAVAAAGDEARADELFREAKSLMGAGHFHEACPKLEEARRLDRGGGIVLALALCHEADGRGATALGEFREALSLAVDAKREERIKLAQEHIASLEKTVSTLTIVAPDQLTDVRVNDAPWPRDKFGVAVPVDAGTYLVQAKGPEGRAWESRVSVRARGDSPRVEIPSLAGTPEPVASPVAPTKSGGGSKERGGGRHTVGLVVGGVGLGVLVVGGVLGVRAMVERSHANCGGSICAGESDTYDSAKSSARWATIATIAGGTLVAAGAVLWLTSPPKNVGGEHPAVAVAPAIAPSGGGLSFVGKF